MAGFVQDMISVLGFVALLAAAFIVFVPSLIEIGRWLEIQTSYLTGSRRK